jgi:hypothetical protein
MDEGRIHGGVPPLSRSDVGEQDDLLTRYREALRMIANMPTVERNPDGVDQAAWSMQLIAKEALDG